MDGVMEWSFSNTSLPSKPLVAAEGAGESFKRFQIDGAFVHEFVQFTAFFFGGTAGARSPAGLGDSSGLALRRGPRVLLLGGVIYEKFSDYLGPHSSCKQSLDLDLLRERAAIHLDPVADANLAGGFSFLAVDLDTVVFAGVGGDVPGLVEAGGPEPKIQSNAVGFLVVMGAVHS